MPHNVTAQHDPYNQGWRVALNVTELDVVMQQRHGDIEHQILMLVAGKIADQIFETIGPRVSEALQTSLNELKETE